MGEEPVRHLQVEKVLSQAIPANDFPDCNVDDLLGQLRELSTRLSGALGSQESGPVDEPTLHKQVANILRFRRKRNKLFGGDLFGEPAWDILLELYLAERNGRRLSVSGACYVSGVPLTTALRWISRLEADGWIRRVDDPLDKRRSWVVLCEETHEKMCEFLSLMVASSA
jgi:DNA-binding MarR family transcriptional regulator